MLNSLLLKAYGGLWTVASPLLRRHRRLAEGFDERLVPAGWPGLPARSGQGGPRIWLQAASGGEAWLAHSLLPAFRRIFFRASAPDPALTAPQPAFLCTSCTRQGLDVLRLLPAEAGAVARLFPLDTPSLMAKALEAAAPDLLVLLETELWPGLLGAARRRGTPVLVVNGRMTEKSFKAYSLFASFWREAAPSRVLAISEGDAQRFAALFRCPVAVMPNIKLDRMAEAAALPTPPSARGEAGIPEETPLAVFASVREEEEDLLVPVIRALSHLRIAGGPVATAVAPRHMHRIGAWRNKLSRAGIPFISRSENAAFTPGSGPLPVYLWDCFGELQALYASADAAFVGGSLAPLGGQNFLEAPAFGVPALVGPHTENFLWVGEDIFSTGLARRVRNSRELAAAMRETLAGRFTPSPLAGAAPVARASAAALIRKRFLAWLGPKTGGGAQAGRAMIDMLLAQMRAAG